MILNYYSLRLKLNRRTSRDDLRGKKSMYRRERKESRERRRKTLNKELTVK